jgi:tRNA (guanine10-N2)-dimethyltransferase
LVVSKDRLLDLYFVTVARAAGVGPAVRESDLPPDRYAHDGSRPRAAVYVLELGGEDDPFAAAEAGTAATGVSVLAPGLALAEAIAPDRLRGLAYTHRASDLFGRTDASLESARVLLAAGDPEGGGTVAVRARDVRGTAGVDTREAERVLGDVLASRGFAVDLDDPDRELRALFAGGTCALGWLRVEADRGFGDRAPTDRPFFQPGSMDPIEARAVANLAGARPGRTVADPMCGTGGLLIEAGLVGADVVGLDAQAKMVRGTRENLAAFLDEFTVARADATRLPVTDGAVDAVVLDAPYGRQSKIAGRDLESLVAGALGEARRVADRGVLVADQSWETRARGADWTVTDRFERPVHRSLTRHVHVLA